MAANYGWSNDFQPYKTFVPQRTESELASPAGSIAAMPAADAASSGISGAGNYISAGGQAAATAANIISQAVAAGARREAMQEQAGLDRGTKERLATMQLGESRYEADTTAKANAYKMLMAALSGQMQNENASFAGQRGANTSMDQLLASAMLRRR